MTGTIRHAIRRLGVARTATIAGILSLGIGIGANSAVFGVADALILRALPYPDAGRIGIIWQRSPGLGVAQDWLSLGQYTDVAAARSFDAHAAAISASYNLVGDGQPERLEGARVTSSFLAMLGGRVQLGRLFASSDDAPGAPPAVILSHAFWMRRYGGDRTIVGRTIQLSGNPVEVVGVLAPDFQLTREVLPTVNAIPRVDFLRSLAMPPSAVTIRGGEDYNVYVHLRPGVSMTTAQAELLAIAQQERQAYPGRYPPSGGLELTITPLLSQVVGDVGLVLRLLLGAAGFVLLIACVNVANLSLSQAAVRERELAIRAAVGASRRDLLKQLIAESLALSLAGGIVGLIIGIGGIAALKAFGPADLPRLAEVGIDFRMLAFTFLVAVIGGLAVGVVPGWHASRTDPNLALREGGRAIGAAAGGGHPRTRRVMVALELAVSLVLLIGSVLLVRSYQRIMRADLGFDPSNTLSLRVSLSRPRYQKAEDVAAFYRQAQEQIAALPGVERVGTNYQLPFSSIALAWEPIAVEGYVPRAAGDSVIITNSAYIGGDYLGAMGMRLIAGRAFTADDNARGAPVVLVDDRLAQRFWPGQDPIGKRIRHGADGPWCSVVGVVANSRQFELVRQPPITVFFASEQYGISGRYVVVRARQPGTAEALTQPVLRALRGIDPDLPLYDVRTMADRVHEGLARRRLAMTLLTAFALLAGVLALIGVYGVVSYWIAQRTREIGIRVALGATRERVYRLISREVLVMVLSGLAAGILGALALTRLLGSLLFGVAARDLPAYALALVMLAAAAALAAFIPARRAARVSPMVALRAE